MSPRDMLLIGIGGAGGAIARAWIGHQLTLLTGNRFPWGTLVVNVLGCLALGFLAQALHSQAASNSLRLLIATGFLGGLTTFSTFGLETVQRWQVDPRLAIANVLANAGLGLLGVLVGMRLASN